MIADPKQADAPGKNVVQLSLAYQRKQAKRKNEAGDFLFEVCRIVMASRRDRIRWVRDVRSTTAFQSWKSLRQRRSRP